MSALSNRRGRIKAATYRAFGEGATWQLAAGGAPIACRVREEAGETVANFGDSPAILPTLILRVRRSEVPNPAEGDTVTIPADEGDPAIIKVTAEPRLEPLGLEWLCEAKRI